MAWLVAIAGWRSIKIVKHVVGEKLDCYFPKFRERVVFKGRKIWRERFLFGKYFFIPYSPEAWAIASMMPSINRLLTFGNEPALVADHEIQELRNREVHGCIPVNRRFRNGQLVRVSEGVMSGVNGRVEYSGSPMIISANGISVKIDEAKLRPI